MAKKYAILLAILILAIAFWELFFEKNVITILINGQEVSGPWKGMVGAGGMTVVLISLVGLAILMAFAFAGTGIILLGCMVVGSVIFAAFMLPFLLPLLIPLILIWAFITIFSQKK